MYYSKKYHQYLDYESLDNNLRVKPMLSKEEENKRRFGLRRMLLRKEVQEAYERQKDMANVCPKCHCVKQGGECLCW